MGDLHHQQEVNSEDLRRPETVVCHQCTPDAHQRGRGLIEVEYHHHDPRRDLSFAESQHRVRALHAGMQSTQEICLTYRFCLSCLRALRRFSAQRPQVTAQRQLQYKRSTLCAASAASHRASQLWSTCCGVNAELNTMDNFLKLR